MANKGFFRRFFGGIGKLFSFIRALFTALFTLLILAYVVIFAGAFFGNSESAQVPDQGALRIAIDGRIVDQLTHVDPIDSLTSPDEPNEYLLRDLVSAIEFAKNDSRISSIVLVISKLEPSGISKIEELGVAIENFKASRKRVVAVSNGYSQSQYLLASYADEIMLHPMGMVELLGLSSYQLYMADAIEKLGINMHVFRTGPHKSAVEPLIANEMSPESREQSQRILDDIWATVSDSILSRRDISAEQLQEYTTNLDQLMTDRDGDLAQLALEFNLVDRLVTRDEMMARLQSIAGKNEAGDFYQYVNADAYLRVKNRSISENENRVGLLVAKGTIYDGIKPAGSIGGDSLAFLLKQARLHDELDALVIRVDSPGGSAFASEVVRRQIELFREEGIPIFVSMGSVAASGGYWISAPADEIWATPTTITGSIGAFAALATFEESLEKLGLNSDGVSTGPLAGALSLDRPMSDKAKNIIQSRIDNLYGQFLSLVSQDREIPLEALEPIAGGRVWTGKQALELGLVDKLGTLTEVLDAAALEAKLGNEYVVHVIESPLSPLQQAFKWISDNMGVQINTSHWITKLFAPVAAQKDQIISELELLSDPENMYLHCGLCQAVQAE